MYAEWWLHPANVLGCDTKSLGTGCHPPTRRGASHDARRGGLREESRQMQVRSYCTEAESTGRDEGGFFRMKTVPELSAKLKLRM